MKEGADCMTSLENKLGLITITPEELVFQEPSARNLRKVLKTKQTPEMVAFVCEKDGLALRHVSKKLITPLLCEAAVFQNGLALDSVPKSTFEAMDRAWTEYLCDIAVSNNGNALQYVPDDFKTEKIINKAICNGAGADEEETEHYPIFYVPNKQVTKELIAQSVSKSPFSLKDVNKKHLTKELSVVAIENNPLALKYIPEKFIDQDMVTLALNKNVMAIEFVPVTLLDAAICRACFDENRLSFIYFPSKYISKEMCLEIVADQAFSIGDRFYPWKMKPLYSNSLPTDVVLFEDFPITFQNDIKVLDEIIEKLQGDPTRLIEWNERLEARPSGAYRNRRGDVLKPFDKNVLDYLASKRATSEDVKANENSHGLSAYPKELKKYVENSILPLPEYELSTAVVPSMNRGRAICHNFSKEPEDTTVFYYVTDIHIEHQLSKWADEIDNEQPEKQKKLVELLLEKKIREMVFSAGEPKGFLLIGGDVSDSVELSAMFYRLLRTYWTGTVVSVLGNHELWDVTSEMAPTRSIESIVEDYRKSIESTDWNIDGHGLYKSVLLENQLFVMYKNMESRVLTEEMILDSSEDELMDFLSKCSVIILGGIGFSGLNPKYNATIGLYRKAIPSLQEDIIRAHQFERVYEKVQSCAGEKPVIVLTHTPVYDWTSKPCRKNWIYVNGHTHHNGMNIDHDGVRVLSDNQIGYTPQKWKLNSFSFGNIWYDPFEQYTDGVYQIDADQYLDFNRGRGISIQGCSYDGTIYMLKRTRWYMFCLQTNKTLCLLIGGQRKRLDRNDVNYYYNHMSEYIDAVQRLLNPYVNVMKRLSDEIKIFGGTGTIHGCIVDISYFSHIYLNPFDGTVTPYWALDTSARKPFESVLSLIEVKEPHLRNGFLRSHENQSLPLLSMKAMNGKESTEKVAVPEWMMGNEIYAPSRIMRSMQYVWEKNVVRIWNDEIIEEAKPKELVKENL